MPNEICIKSFAGARSYCNFEELVVRVREKTWKDFGKPDIKSALSIPVDSLEREAPLHTLGRVLMKIHLLGLLKTRLRLENVWRADRVDVPQPEIVRPIFITGMPRSGSTFLHELMAQDTALRAPRAWEVMFPVTGERPRLTVFRDCSPRFKVLFENRIDPWPFA